MLNQPIEASLNTARHTVDQSAQWTQSVRSRIGRFFTAAHRAVTLLGIAALFVLGMMFFNPDFADKIIAMSPFSAEEPVEQTEPVVPPLASLMDTPAASFATTGATASSIAAGPMTAEERQMIGNPRQQKLVTNWLAKRYRVAGDATDMLVSAAYLTAREIKLDPLLILAVMAIESRFNPFAESSMGAQGLMQVMSKIHHDKFQELGGVKAALNPVANIKVGSLILKEYVTRGGSVEAGLKTYVGAAEMENDGGYGAKVLSEYHNLKEVATGKNVSIFTTAIVRRPTVAAQPKNVSEGEVASADKKQAGSGEQFAAL